MTATDPAPLTDDRHALYAGWIAGMALRQGVVLRPVYDAAGTVTAALTLELPVGPVSVTLIVPPPPPGWALDA